MLMEQDYSRVCATLNTLDIDPGSKIVLIEKFRGMYGNRVFGTTTSHKKIGPGAHAYVDVEFEDGYKARVPLGFFEVQ